MPGTAFVYDADDVTHRLIGCSVPEEVVRKHLPKFLKRGDEIMGVGSMSDLDIIVREVTGTLDDE